MNAIQPKMLRAKQVAEIYSIGLSTVWLLVKQNKLKAYRPSTGTTLFRLDEVNQYFLGICNDKKSKKRGQK